MLWINNVWGCLGETHIGKSHISSNLPCQDKIAFICNNKITAGALCDGLGSQANSHYGAAIVSNKVVDILTNNFNELFNMTEEETVQNILMLINKETDIFSTEREISKKTLECTLQFFAIKKNKYIIGKIGDGALMTFKDQNIVDNLYLEKGNSEIEYANSTYTVFDRNASDHFFIKKGDSREIDSLFMISDGLPFLSVKGKVAKKVHDFLDLIGKSKSYLASNKIYNEISEKVKETDFCIDDWSYIFVKKVNIKNNLKTYFDKHYNNIGESK